MVCRPGPQAVGDHSTQTEHETDRIVGRGGSLDTCYCGTEPLHMKLENDKCRLESLVAPFGLCFNETGKDNDRRWGLALVDDVFPTSTNILVSSVDCDDLSTEAGHFTDAYPPVHPQCICVEQQNARNDPLVENSNDRRGDFISGEDGEGSSAVPNVAWVDVDGEDSRAVLRPKG